MSEENKDMEINEQEDMGILYLTDEEGKEFPFQFIDVINYEEQDYAILFPAEESELDDEDDGEVVILRVTPHDDGSADFETIEDTDILDAVFNIFMENLQQSFAAGDEEIEALGGECHCHDEHCCDCGDENCCQ